MQCNFNTLQYCEIPCENVKSKLKPGQNVFQTIPEKRNGNIRRHFTEKFGVFLARTFQNPAIYNISTSSFNVN